MAYIKDRWFTKDGDGNRVRTDRHGKGNRWQLVYTDDAGKTHYPTFAKKVDAERHRATVEADMLRGTYVNPDKGRVLFRDYTEQWRKAQVQHAPNTVDLVRSDLEHHILPTFGDMAIGAIRRSHIQPWATALSAVLAPRSVRRVYTTLAAILRAAAADEVIVRTPCTRINLPTVTKTRVTPLPTLAIEAVIEAAPNRWRSAFILGAGSGMREGEILGLTLDRAEFLARRVQVNRQAQTPSRSGTPHLRPLKTVASERTIPLPDVVLAALSEHVRLFPPELVEVDEYTDRAAGSKPKRVAVRLLYSAARGGIMRRSVFLRVWVATCARAAASLRERAAEARRAGRKQEADECDAAADRLSGKCDFHELRHFYASMLIFAGENVKVVQARLGHKSAVETLDTYGHLWPDSEDATRAAVDAVLGAAISGAAAQPRPRVAR